MAIDWSSLGGGSLRTRFDWSYLGLSDEEIEEKKRQKRLELARLAGEESVSDRFLPALEERARNEPGLRVNPVAARIGAEQAAEMGIAPSRGILPTLGPAWDRFKSESLELFGAPIRANRDFIEGLEPKPEDNLPVRIAKVAAAASPIGLFTRAQNAVAGMVGADEWADENARRSLAARERNLAENPVTGPITDTLALGAGMVLDPLSLAGIGAAVGRKVVPKAVSKLPVALTSKFLSKEGGLPSFIWEGTQRAKRAGEGADFLSAELVRDVDEALVRNMDEEIAGGLRLEPAKRRAQIEEQIQAALTAGDDAAIRALPPRLVEPVLKMRAEQDRVSHGMATAMLGSEQAALELRGIVRGKFGITAEGLADNLTAAQGGDKDAVARLQEMDGWTGGAVGRLFSHMAAQGPQRRATAIRYLKDAGKAEFNLGSYLHQSHLAYDDPRYGELLSANEQSRVFQDFKDWAIKHGKAKTDEEAAQWGRAILNEIKARDIGQAERSVFPDYPQALQNVLKERQNIPPVIHEFLGLNKDFRTNFQRGMVQASEIAEDIRAYNDLFDEGASRGVFRLGPEDGTGNTSDMNYKVTKGTRFVAPKGQAVFTYPEIGAIMDGSTVAAREGKKLLRWQMANSAVRMGWTVLSPAMQAVNSLGAFMLSGKAGNPAAIGEFMRQFAQQAGRDVSRAMGAIPTALSPEDMKFYQEVAKRGGLTSGGLIADERRHLGALTGIPSRGIRGALTPGPRERLGLGNAKSRAADFLKGAVGKTLDVAAATFSAADSAMRTTLIKERAKDLSKAYPGWSYDQVMDEAVRRGLLESPSPEHSPQVAQAIRNNAAIGSFITYPAEMLRTTYNSLELALRDARKALFGDPQQLLAEGVDAGKLSNMAVKNLTGLVGSISAVSGLSGGLEWTLEKIHGSDLNTDEIKAARSRLLPEFYRQNDMSAVHTDGAGREILLDWSPMNAFGTLYKPAVAAIASLRADEGAFEAAMAGLKEAASPFLNIQPVAQFAIEALTGNRRGGTGSAVTNPEKSAGGQAADWLAHGASTIFPAPIKDAIKIGKASAKEDEYEMARVFANQLGLRTYRFDALKELQAKARFEHAVAYKNAMGLRNEAVKSNPLLPLTAGPIKEAENEAQASWMETADEIRRDIDAARTLGKSDQEIFKALKDGGLAKKHILALLGGQTLPLSWKDD